MDFDCWKQQRGLWSSVVLWSDIVLWSDVVLWSDMVLQNDVVLQSNVVLWSNIVLHCISNLSLCLHCLSLCLFSPPTIHQQPVKHLQSLPCFWVLLQWKGGQVQQEEVQLRKEEMQVWCRGGQVLQGRSSAPEEEEGRHRGWGHRLQLMCCTLGQAQPSYFRGAELRWSRSRSRSRSWVRGGT